MTEFLNSQQMVVTDGVASCCGTWPERPVIVRERSAKFNNLRFFFLNIITAAVNHHFTIFNTVWVRTYHRMEIQPASMFRWMCNVDVMDPAARNRVRTGTSLWCRRRWRPKSRMSLRRAPENLDNRSWRLQHQKTKQKQKKKQLNAFKNRPHTKTHTQNAMK